MKTTHLQSRLYLVAVIILAVGLGASLLIYLTAGNPSDVSMDDYQNTKKYLRDMELYGGTMNVLMDQFRGWFEGLWHGKSLATTIACITIFLSSCFCLVAYNLPSLHSDDRERGNRGGK
jgi:hypothetical protein